MTRQSALGPHADRQKTDMRMPYPLATRVEEMAEILGVPRNAMYAMGAALLCVTMAGMVHPGKKRLQLLAEMKTLFQKVISEAEKTT